MNKYIQELQLLADKVDGLCDDNWQEIAEKLKYPYSVDTLRKSLNGQYGGAAVFRFMNDNQNKYNSNEQIKQLENLKDELYRERIKTSDKINQYKDLQRKQARYEEVVHQWEQSINNLNPIKIKSFVPKDNIDNEVTGVIFIADAHVGRDVILNGLFGEVINKYNLQEFETRMWNLLNQIENDLYDMKVNKFDIIDLGDNIEGILRIGESLKNLQAGVIQSAVYYAEFMATWIIECYNRLQIPVSYSLTSGNHDILRLLDSKPNFADETVGQFIYSQISLRVENSKLKSRINGNKNINIQLEPYNDVSYHNYYGMNMLCYHGEDKDLKSYMEFAEDYYKIDIDVLVAGHLHSGFQQTVGVGYMGDKEVIRVPSICGSDIYSKKIRKNSRAGSKFITFSKNGKGWEKTYYLN